MSNTALILSPYAQVLAGNSLDYSKLLTYELVSALNYVSLYVSYCLDYTIALFCHNRTFTPTPEIVNSLDYRTFNCIEKKTRHQHIIYVSDSHFRGLKDSGFTNSNAQYIHLLNH